MDKTISLDNKLDHVRTSSILFPLLCFSRFLGFATFDQLGIWSDLKVVTKSTSILQLELVPKWVCFSCNWVQAKCLGSSESD